MLLLAALMLAVPASLQAGVEEAVAPAGGTVGFAALDLTSGRSFGLREQEPFPLQSVFKLPIAIETLRRVDAGKLDLDREIALTAADARGGPTGTMVVPARRTVGQLLEAMVVTSDNVATDKLLALLGGPPVVDAGVRALGLHDITIRFSERELGTGRVDNTATPAALVALLAKVARREAGLSPTSAQRLEDILARVSTGQKSIKGLLPPGTPVAHKTGMSGTQPADQGGKTDATNDVGLISLPNGHRVAVAIFVHASPADLPTRELTIARLARLVYDTFNVPAPSPPR